MKLRNWLGAAGALSALASAATVNAQATDLGPLGPLVGYHHTTFKNGSADGLQLDEIPREWTTVNLSFAEPMTQLGSNFGLRAVDSGVYASEQELIADIKTLKDRGVNVFLSLGGAEGVATIDNAQRAAECSRSLNALIDKFGITGLDIDFEGGTISLAPGDTDFENPTSPRVNGVIQCIRGVLSEQGPGFGLSMAPETFFVQVGMEVYAGAAGAYLPIIDEFRDQIDSLQVQLYNTGSVTGLDGVAYPPATQEHLVSLTEMLLQGFTVAGSGKRFRPLLPRQVRIGLPSTPFAAGRGFVDPSVVISALDQLTNGTNGGRYGNRGGPYPDLGGVMAFSINHAIRANNDFNRRLAPRLAQLRSARVQAGLVDVLR
jgi:chitinase